MVARLFCAVARATLFGISAWTPPLAVALLLPPVAGTVRAGTLRLEGLERYGVTVRYPRDLRDDPERIASEVFVTTPGGMVPLGQVADIAIQGGAPAIRTENGLLVAYVFVDTRESDLGVFVARAQKAVAETGVVMLIYLDHAWREAQARCAAEGRDPGAADLYAAVMEGAVGRVRPKMMTTVTVIAGLLPIMWSTGTGSEVMRRIAAPMVGGMVSSTILTLIVIPALYALVKQWEMRRTRKRALAMSAPAPAEATSP